MNINAGAIQKTDLADLPPGPWEYMTTAKLNDHHGMGHVYIVDATGKKLMSLWGTPDVKMALATLIIEARDRVGP